MKKIIPENKNALDSRRSVVLLIFDSIGLGHRVLSTTILTTMNWAELPSRVKMIRRCTKSTEEIVIVSRGKRAKTEDSKTSAKQIAYVTFITWEVGPTGVENAGAIAEMAWKLGYARISIISIRRISKYILN